MKKVKGLGVSGVPFLLGRINNKRQELFLFDSGDNLDTVSLEIEAISNIGSESIPFLVSRLEAEKDEQNFDIAFRAALVQALAHLLPLAEGKDFPFTSCVEVKARLKRFSERRKRQPPFLPPGGSTISFIEEQLSLPKNSLSEVLNFR
ncbi:MAG: hypothetical protein HQM10_11445 [Candidatus Riflebacteria bacterium]|nr:hypothetical protein [Candidatus Riflebacteria bacterium]